MKDIADDTSMVEGDSLRVRTCGRMDHGCIIWDIYTRLLACLTVWGIIRIRLDQVDGLFAERLWARQLASRVLYQEYSVRQFEGMAILLRQLSSKQHRALEPSY